MRTIGFRTHILFAIAAAFGVVAALGQPWYGPSEPPTNARMEDLFGGIGRAFTVSIGTTGWQAFETADTIIAGMAIGTAILAILTMWPLLQPTTQPLARWFGLATFAVVATQLIDAPGVNSATEPRQGLLIALGSAAVLVASTMTVAAAPVRRKTEPRTYTPPPAPEYLPESTYGPQQF